jgi:protocatechuate 3,4-dioxygenase alpha subunit
MTRRGLTPSQTVGPFFHGIVRDGANVLVTPYTQGDRIRIEGRVLDGDGAAVPDAVVEIWQANARGRYRHPADRRDLPLDTTFIGFGRARTDAAGAYWFDTVKPGPVPYVAADTWQAPHVNVAIAARGLLNHLLTRIYFGDESANQNDPVLQRVPEARRPTLVAARTIVNGAAVYRFDIVLQGRAETVFFDL